MQTKPPFFLVKIFSLKLQYNLGYFFDFQNFLQLLGVSTVIWAFTIFVLFFALIDCFLGEIWIWIMQLCLSQI